MKNNNREITVSTVTVEELTGLPTFRAVESWALQFTNNIHLKVIENTSVDANQTIEYEANSRGLTVDSEWTTVSDKDIILIIKACFPQKSEGQEFSSTQQIEYMQANAHLFCPGEKGGPKIFQSALHFCDLLPESKAQNISYRGSGLILCGKNSERRVAQQNLAITDNGFIVTPNPCLHFHSIVLLTGPRVKFDERCWLSYS
jgi:hypothetical protein